jgi:hypothetical protein
MKLRVRFVEQLLYRCDELAAVENTVCVKKPNKSAEGCALRRQHSTQVFDLFTALEPWRPPIAILIRAIMVRQPDNRSQARRPHPRRHG